MATTLQDIAALTGFSKSTVSRVLNNKGEECRISARTREVVLKAAEKLNYRPNQLARGLRLKRTQTIGLIIPDISNPFFAYTTRMIQSFAFDEMGYSLIVCNTNEDLATEIEQVELLKSKGVDGFIIMPVGLDDTHISHLVQDGFAVVLLDRCFEDLEISSVVVDNYAGSYEAVEHIINKGHRRIAIVQGLPNTSTNTARVKGYRDALTDYGISVNETYIVGRDFRQENGYIETKALLERHDRPTAIFATSDLITLGVFRAIHEVNYKVPDDISLVCFDDVDFAPFLVSPLTVVHQPRTLMGEHAVKLLMDEISTGGTVKKKVVLKPQLVVRGSVRDLRTNKTTVKAPVLAQQDVAL